ncbi:MAG: UDP-N-acetylglucosamine--N-acetylmuramyl-(pentapeptide) pyrophosphoryl-undecaprenol N-acetylglucosamine transferase [Planctomycetota bacterium]|jgi:UDP-N-acetylglucosamine--N-acetylmuramyl-(pentapeptide) pyrophosphoryl-undecaprenol N-acetylglucosamine transferase
MTAIETRGPDVPAAPAPGPPRTFLFAGGGSGGHISPGLAIAQRLAELDPASRSVFACSRRAIDATMLDAAGATSVAVDAAPLAWRPAGLVRFAVGARRARRQVEAVIAERDVEAVVALGGFVAAPAVAAARRAGRPAILLNLDALPGRANRWMARRATAVLTAVEVDRPAGFATRVVGMPVRREALADDAPAACRRRLGLDPERPTLLVTGASQGATSINRLLVALVEAEPALLDGWQVCHLAGAGADAPVRAAYEAAGVPAVVRPLLDRMGLAWGAADLAVSRAGASSVAEATANAVPALYLPYPFHRDRHQVLNARPAVAAGGAVMIDDLVDPARNRPVVAPRLRDLVRDEPRRAAMRRALRALAPGDAAGTVARLLLDRAIA